MTKQATTKEDGRRLTYYWFTKNPPAQAKSKLEVRKDDRPQS